MGNPIIEHAYMGPEVLGKTMIVVDDMIASGASMLEVSEELRKRQAKNIYLVSTFALFTEGVDNFKLAYERKIFDKVYATNASYISKEILNEEFLTLVDISNLLANVINDLNNSCSLEKYF